MVKSFFAAYPGSLKYVCECFEGASKKLNLLGVQLHTWEQNDICGIPLTDPIFKHIEDSEALVADITELNFNVTFEIGYAIAKRKRVFLVKNSAFDTRR